MSENDMESDTRWDSFWTIVDDRGNPILHFNETGIYGGNGKKLAPNDDEPPKEE